MTIIPNTRCVMKFTLPDGQNIETDLIKEITTVRDHGVDPKSIDRSILSFTIHLKGAPSVKVSEYYHFADWAEAKMRLINLRKQLCAMVDQNACKDGR